MDHQKFKQFKIFNNKKLKKTINLMHEFKKIFKNQVTLNSLEFTHANFKFSLINFGIKNDIT
jgi:hypothetical protein